MGRAIIIAAALATNLSACSAIVARDITPDVTADVARDVAPDAEDAPNEGESSNSSLDVTVSLDVTRSDDGAPPDAPANDVADTASPLATECANAIRITPEVPLLGLSSDGLPLLDRMDTRLCDPLRRGGPFLYYALSIPPRTRAHLPLNAVAFPRCEPSACLTAANGTFPLENPRDVPLEIVLAIRGATAGALVHLESLGSAPVDQCRIRRARAASIERDESAGFILSSDDPDRVFGLHVEERSLLDFTEAHTSTRGDPTLCLASRCGDRAAMICNDVRPYRGVSTLRHYQVLEPGDYDLVIANEHPGAGPIAYGFRLAAHAASPGTHCETAPDGGAGGNTASGEQSPLLDPTARRRQFFRVTIPAAHHVVLRGYGGLYDNGYVVRLLDRCDGTVLWGRTAQFHDGGGAADPPVQVRLGNAGDTDRSLIIVVEELDSRRDGPFSIGRVVYEPVPNAACESATPIPFASGSHGGDLRAAVASVAFDTSTFPGALHYALTVPAGRSLSFQAWGASYASRATMLDRCGGSILAESRYGYSGRMPGRYTNTSGADQNLILRLTAADLDHASSASVSITVDP